jgi:hypothetical protein
MPKAKSTSKPAPLTAAQKMLMAELNGVAEAAGMDFWNAQSRDSNRTEFLQMALRQFVNARIIARYTMLDEYLTMIICDLYFPRRKGEKSYGRLWKNDSFRIFNHFLLDETFTIPKMNMVKAMKPLPANVEHTINRINALRNVVAHSFFPENRRKHMPAKKVLYDGSDIYSLNGIRKLEADFQTVRQCLSMRLRT